MSWEAIGATAEVVGALAVIASIVYLATQIRSSSEIARGQSQRELLEISAWFAGASTNSELRDAIRAGFDNFSTLNKDQQLQFHSWIHPIAAQVEAAYRMNKDGLLEDESYVGFRDGFISMIKTKGGAAWWETCSFMFVDFGVEINSKLQESSTIEPWSELIPFFGTEQSANDT